MSLSTPKGPFDIDINDLKTIGAVNAVDLFHKLLVSEAIQCAKPVGAISVPEAITTADGGIDAEIEAISGIVIPLGFIRDGKTRYQIKTGSFSASTPGDLRSLILKQSAVSEKGTLTPNHLNPRVKACLDYKGTFIAVLFGSDAVGIEEGYGVKELKDLLISIDAEYTDAKIEIIRANQICKAISAISPGIALQLNGLAGSYGSQLYGLSFLANNCALEIDKYIETTDIAQQSAAITLQADELNGFKHIRILGDAGSGKTHLVYNALAKSLNPEQVLYCPYAEELSSSGPFSQLVTRFNKARIVLVADECDFITAATLIARFKNTAEHFLLITIFNQSSNDNALGPETQIVEVPYLEKPAMVEIFDGYGIPQDKREWLAGLLEGSPRAAHAIGKQIVANPEIEYADHFSTLNALWEQYVCSPDQRDSLEGANKLAVARCFALFRKVTWSGYDGESSKAQLEKVISLVTNLSKAQIAALVKRMQDRRILQGHTTLYISPKLLHIKLWCDWWDNFSHIVDDEWLTNSFDGKMREWFNEMFEYAKESKAATQVVDKLLSPTGPLSKLEYFEKQGMAHLFFALAQADSKVALRRLKVALESASFTQRKNFKNGRREVVHGLERLAIPEANFFDAAQCLLLLAEAENETWSNNASGIFESLFTLGYGKMAASECAPLDKIPYLRNLLQSDRPAYRKLALQAVIESLKPFLSRTDIGDTAGLRKLPERWSPKTYGDIWNAYSAHIELLAEIYFCGLDEDKKIAAQGIISYSRNLIAIHSLAPRVIELLKVFSSDSTLRLAVTEAVENIMHYDSKGLPQNIIDNLKFLKDDLTEKSFHDKLVRYAGMQLTEDSFDEVGNYREGPHPSLFAVRDVIIKDPELISPELPWLVTEEAKNGFTLGILLGEVSSLLWPSIVNEYIRQPSTRTDFFIGGYLAGIFTRDPTEWEEEIMKLFGMPDLANEMVGLIWRSGMTHRIAAKLLENCRAGIIAARQFRLFVYGGRVKDFPTEVIIEVVEILNTSNDPIDVDTALDLLQSRLRLVEEDKSILIPVLEQTLNHPAFILGSTEKTYSNNMRDYHWAEGAEILLSVTPEKTLSLGIKCIENFGATNSITDSFDSKVYEFLDSLLVKFPKELWEAIGKRLENGVTTSNYDLLQWLRGRDRVGRSNKISGLELIDHTLVLNWIKIDPENRGYIIAHYCPPALKTLDEPQTLARRILEAFGDIDSIRDAMHANFWTSFFSGPASQYYQSRLDEINKLLSAEINVNVRRWLYEEVDRLERTIPIELAREEARF